MGHPTLTAIVAYTENHVIGLNGGMPWHLPADFAHFKRLSVGKPNIMGRKLYDSLGSGLKGRTNIVLTRNTSFRAEGCIVVHTPWEAIEAAGAVEDIAIIGGEEIYRLFLPYTSIIERTIIHTHLDGDTFFPELTGEWDSEVSNFRAADQKNRFDMTFETLTRPSKYVDNLGDLKMISKLDRVMCAV